MPKPPPNLTDFSALVQVIETLRGPGGCPWDQEQTHDTLTRFAIEEAHEFAEAVQSGDPAEIRDELGDLLLQVVLNAEVARQDGAFAIADVIRSINEKMIRRHPHVFADAHVEDSAEVLRNWAEIKKAEKPSRASTHGFDVPTALPALLRAHKVGEKCRARGFDWDTPEQCWRKVEEELGELRAAVANESSARVEAEFGDVLFSLAQWGRLRGFDAESALRKTNASIEARYKRMREAVDREGLIWDELAEDARERYWKAAKAADQMPEAAKAAE